MTEHAAARRTRRPYVLIACMLAMFMAAVEATIVATAMPTIIAVLGGFKLFSWVFAIYLLTQAVSIPIYGKLADMYGRKPAFFAGAAIFLLSSAAAGCSGNMVQLILFRALQGIGAGAIMPIATTIIADVYTAEERGHVQGYLASVWGVSAVVGPILGAFFVEHVGWSLVFWVNLPIGAVAIGLLAAFLDEGVRRSPHSVDYPGAVLMMTGTTALMLALIQGTSLAPALEAALLALALLCLAGFIYVERRATEPMMPLGIWRHRIIAAGNVSQLVSGAVMIGVTSFVPTYIQGVFGGSAGTAGLALTAMLVGWPVASTYGGRLMVRTTYRLTAVIGGLCLVAGAVVLALLTPARGALWAGIGALFIGLGMGFCNTTYVVAVQSTVDWNRRGVATSVNLFMRMVGQSVGVAIYGALLNIGIERHAPGASDLVNRMMEPATRRLIQPDHLALLVRAIADALHDVFLIAALFAGATLVLAFGIPARVNPGNATAASGSPGG